MSHLRPTPRCCLHARCEFLSPFIAPSHCLTGRAGLLYPLSQSPMPLTPSSRITLFLSRTIPTVAGGQVDTNSGQPIAVPPIEEDVAPEPVTPQLGPRSLWAALEHLKSRRVLSKTQSASVPPNIGTASEGGIQHDPCRHWPGTVRSLGDPGRSSCVRYNHAYLGVLVSTSCYRGRPL